MEKISLSREIVSTDWERYHVITAVNSQIGVSACYNIYCKVRKILNV
jgi:hypothetical protein